MAGLGDHDLDPIVSVAGVVADATRWADGGVELDAAGGAHAVTVFTAHNEGSVGAAHYAQDHLAKRS